MSSLFPDILLKMKIGTFTLLSFIRQKNFRTLIVVTAPDISNALKLAYKARKLKLAIQVGKKKKKFVCFYESCVPYESI